MKMRKIKTLFLICAIGSFLVSCKKEADLQDQAGQGNGNNSITGKWNFLGMTVLVKTSITAGSGGQQEKLITSYGYNSENNVGTVVIDASHFTMTGIGYSVDTTVNEEFYENGILTDFYQTPFQTIIPPYNASVPYKAIGTDSMFFQSGFISFDPTVTGGVPVATTAIGSKLSWSNDTLLLKTLYSDASIQNVNGINAQVVTNLSQVVKLKK